MSNEHIAAVDVGSTRLKYAVLTDEGEFVTEVDDRSTGKNGVSESVAAAVGELVAAERVDAVSIVTTGLVDSDRGVVQSFDTVDGRNLEDVPLARAPAEAHGLPTYLVNDCNAAAVGEWRFGAGADYDCVVYVTIATGVGAGIVEGGRLLEGEHGHAGEVGLVTLAPFDDLTSSGVTGAWEAYCGGRGIPDFARSVLRADDRESVLRDLDDLQAPDVFQAADAGDDVANDLLELIGRYNAAGLGSVINVVNPGIVTLGGGVVLNNPDVVTDAIDRNLDEFVYVERPRIEVTELGQHLELLGAVAYADLDSSTPIDV